MHLPYTLMTGYKNIFQFGCLITFTVLSVIASSSIVCADNKEIEKPLSIMGYWFNGGWPHYDSTAMNYVDEVVIFAVAPDASTGGIQTFSHDAEKNHTTYIRASDKPGLTTEMITTLVNHANAQKVLTTLGINGMGKKEASFNQLVIQGNQKKFAENVLALCQKHGISGVDVDYEHPKSAEDVEYLGAIFTALHKTLSPHNIRITGAFGVKNPHGKDFLAKYHHLLDQINVMSYKATFNGFVQRLQGLDALNIPRDKVFAGIAFYGKDGKAKYSMDYRDIVSHPDYTKPLDIYHLSDPRDSSKNLRLVSYSSDETLIKKLTYLRQKHYAGVMIWALNHDLPMSDPRARLPFVYKLAKHGADSLTTH